MHVTENRYVLTGLTEDNVRWAFAGEFDQWHPLTWLSYQADAQVWGGRPVGFHLTNLLLHAANAVLLFLALRRLTEALVPSAVAAALFALHPLNVESVAWVSERKGVLGGFFFMLTLLAYAGYAKRPRWWRYALTAILFALALMAKGVLVTVPCLLLLLDYWPLGRVTTKSLWWLVAEKLPLLAIAATFIGVNYQSEQRAGTLQHGQTYTLAARLANAVESYWSYLGKTLWPADLIPFYPHPGNRYEMGAAVAAGLALAGVTVLALRFSRRWPYLIVGWLWFLGMLSPVIGLVPVGSHAMADRYAYIPTIGLFVMAAWGLADLVGQRTAIAVALTVGAVLGVVTFIQAGYWHDSFRLWSHAVRVNPRNALAHESLAEALEERKEFGKAIREFEEALKLDPAFALAQRNLGVLLVRDNPEVAIRYLRLALEVFPRDADLLYSLGRANAELGNAPEAIRWYRQALGVNPGHRLAQQRLQEISAARKPASP
jgi:tetratricopeptide (TPR) repeat protein